MFALHTLQKEVLEENDIKVHNMDMENPHYPPSKQAPHQVFVYEGKIKIPAVKYKNYFQALLTVV